MKGSYNYDSVPSAGPSIFSQRAGEFAAQLLQPGSRAAAHSADRLRDARVVSQSSVYFYDVAPSDMHGKGKLMIDVDKHTFVFNGQDFTPSAHIELRAMAEGSTEHIVFASGQATPAGNLHIAGSWEGHAAPAAVATGYVGISAIALDNDGWFVAQLACYYSTDDGVTWRESAHSKDIVKGKGVNSGLLSNLGVPAGALVKIHAIVIGGKDRTGSEVFQYVGYFNWYLAWYYIDGVTWNPALHFIEIGLWKE